MTVDEERPMAAMTQRRRVDRAVLLAATLVALASALLAAPPASADGDPASDVLPGRDIFVPYLPKLSPPFSRALTQAVVSARKHGYPVKVALVASKIDLGSVALLYGRPQEYARFLATELRLLPFRGVVLVVVMPHGVGAMRLGRRPTAIRAPRIAIPPGPTTDLGGGYVAYDTDTLARTAILAVVRLAASAGRPLPAVAIPRPAAQLSPPAAGPTRSPAAAIVVVLALLLLAAGSAGVWRIRKRRAC
jgi:hypothetical protein